MQIDSRLNDIDDCLYRVAARVLLVQNGKLLLIREAGEAFWSFPGGGVDHGETLHSTLGREVEEELGVPAGKVISDSKMAYYNIGKVVNGIPRMNIFFKITVPEELLQKTNEIAEWAWFTKAEFLDVEINSSYDRSELAGVIFSD